MTDEAHGDNPEEAPAPPTSTRWSEDAVAEDDAPPPPFVPGRREPPVEATPGAEPATGERTPEGGAEPTAPEPFPFERPVDVEEREAAEEHEAAVEAAEEAVAATDTAEDDFPFEQFDIEGRGEGTGPADAGSAVTADSDMGGGWSPTDVLEQEGDDVPTPEPGVEPGPDRHGPAVPAHATPSEPSAPPAADNIEETATLLDRMADVLRSEGEAGVRRELDSPDRLTAVLAGILAGYLSGRS